MYIGSFLGEIDSAPRIAILGAARYWLFNEIGTPAAVPRIIITDPVVIFFFVVA